MKEENNKSKNISIIISSNGNNKEAWENLLNNIISNDSNINNDIISNIYQFLIEKKYIEINLDILDFIVQYGSFSIIELFVNKNLSKQILELLKNNSKSSLNVQKKIIFLIQKWARKYEKENQQIYLDFINNYKSLKKAGITFPPDNFKMTTYEKYISDEEAKNIINKIKTDNENNFANPFLSEMIETNNKVDKKIFTNESCLKKNINDDNEENPYNQDNKFNNNNIKNNNNFNNNYNMNSKGYPGNINNGLNEQKSHYPKFPSQFKTDNMNNLGKTDNIRQNNNIYPNNNNNSKNQFPNNNNSYNNKNNYMNSNFNKINNNNNNNNNYNRNVNYNNNIKNNNSNNNNFNNNNAINYNRSNTNYNYNNNRIINNNKNFNNIFSTQNNNNINDFISYKKTLGNRLLQLNSWINEGKYSPNLCKLKEGIIEIVNEIPNCENMMNKCKINSDKKGYETYRNMKMDMEQTCARYEDLVNDWKVEPFLSSFFGNSRQYYFNKSQMFGNKKFSVPNNFNDYYKNSNNIYESSNQNPYGASYNRNNYDEREVSVEDKLVEYGGKVKDGLCFVGGKIKDTAISGFNFVKNKINEDDDLSDI